MPDISAVGRLAKLEFRKIFKGKAFYIVLAIMVAFTALITSTRNDSFPSQEEMIRQQVSQSVSELERGEFGAVITVSPDGSFSMGPPPGINFSDRPLRDASGQLIPENIEFYKQLYLAYAEEQISNIVEGPRAGIGFIMGETATQIANMIPMLSVALAIGIFVGDYRGGYRLMVSRGVRRANVMSAKLAATLGLALILALVFTIVLTLGSVGAENSGGLGSLTASDLLGVFGVALLMFTAYMLFGALVGTFFTSSGSAMAIGLVLAFVSASFYFNLTPEDDFIFLSLFSPVSLGYNFNSLMYYVWRAGEESSRYRDVIPSVAVVLAYSSIFVGFIYGIFSKKQLRG